jgi:hypothetical protein
MQPVPDLPDTAVARAAIQFSRSTASTSVFNHSVRSYLFGELLAATEGLRAGADYGSVEGADMAAALLTSTPTSSTSRPPRRSTPGIRD